MPVSPFGLLDGAGGIRLFAPVMRFHNVSIAGLAYLDAPLVVPTTDIERQLWPTAERLGIRLDLLTALTGIEERRFWERGVQPSEVATAAAEQALHLAGVERSRVGVIVSTSVCKDYIEPSVAALVHGNLRLPPTCLNFDIGNACLAFLNGMEMVSMMIERGAVDVGLVVDGEGSRFAVESTIARLQSPACDAQMFRDNFATLTLGSGAAAAVLARSDLAPHGHRFLGGVALAATEHNRLCVGQPDEMRTDPTSLLVAGVALARRTFEQARIELGWSPEILDEIVIHQVSAAHTDRFVEAIGVDPRKVFAIYPRFGNIGPAAIPITLGKARDAGRLRRGARVGLMGIGSGLNCSMMEIVWLPASPPSPPSWPLPLVFVGTR
jgi:3-oxoacyl-[acyl-carrier-protein] synthase-3